MDNLNHNQLIEIVSRSLIESKKNKFLIALSGGIDSILLLNIVNIICRSKKYQLRAIHINHKISKNANVMQKHCVDICNNLKIDLLTKEINDVANSNIEENLRNKRYDLIFQSMYDDEALLLGHHNNDQIETFLYRLFRGSSPLGLSCMDKISKRGTNTICRPFLSISKFNIVSIAKYLKIKFIDDASNNDLNYDRNYIREKIIPNIINRWGSFNNIMDHNISLQSDYSKLVHDYCKSLYDNIIIDNKLDIKKLKSYPSYLESIFLKYWLKTCFKYDLSKSEIKQIQLIIHTNNNDYPEYKLRNNTSIIRYNDFLYTNEPIRNMTSDKKLWDMKKDIDFGNFNFSLDKLKEEGLYASLSSKAPLTLRHVEGKEKIMLNNKYYQDLKKVFQSNSIPIWEREKFVLFFSNNELLVAYGENHLFISSELR